EIGNAIAKSFQLRSVGSGLISTIENLTNWFTNLSSSSQKVILGIAAITAAIPPLIAALGALSFALGAITWPVAAGAAIVAGLALIATKIIITQSKIESFKRALENLNEISLDALVKEISNATDVIATRISRNMTTAGQAITGFLKILDAL